MYTYISKFDYTTCHVTYITIDIMLPDDHYSIYSPILGIVIRYGQFTGDKNVVKVDILAHAPQFKPDSCNGAQAVVGSLVVKVGGVFYLTGCPLSLQYIIRSAIIKSIFLWEKDLHHSLGCRSLVASTCPCRRDSGSWDGSTHHSQLPHRQG